MHFHTLNVITPFTGAMQKNQERPFGVLFCVVILGQIQEVLDGHRLPGFVLESDFGLHGRLGEQAGCKAQGGQNKTALLHAGVS